MVTKLNLSQDVQEAIQKAYHCRTKYYLHQASIAYDGECSNYPICEVNPFDRAVIMCCCLDVLYERYRQTGLPEETIWETLSDIPLRLGLYQKKYGKIGLGKEDVIWFRHLWNCELFQIGSLQYHKFRMIYLDTEGCGEDYMAFTEKLLPQGAPVWNVHVPRGTNLSPGSVAGSMDRAGKLLPEIFPEHRAAYFLCYSWLLYPGLKNLLPERSNIRSFADAFTVIGSVQDPSEAISCIYGKRYPRKAAYPQDTSLQCAALGHFSQLGYSCGIRKMDIT